MRNSQKFIGAVLGVIVILAACGWASAQAPATAKKVVYAWFPKNPNNYDTKAIDWTAITHICYRSVSVGPDGSLRDNTNPRQVKPFIEEAHRHGVKVAVLVWGMKHEGVKGSYVADKYLAEAPDKAAKSLLEYMQANNLDGVCLDDETWRVTNSVTKGSNRELVTKFFHTLRTTLDAARPGYHICWASPPAATGAAQSWFDFVAIANDVDAFGIMSFCRLPPTVGWSGSLQPVGGGKTFGGQTWDYASVIQGYLDATGNKPDKLLLGIDILGSGREWSCQTDQPLSRTLNGAGRALTTQEGQANAKKYGLRWDPQQRSHWYCYKDGDHWVQGWYEDDESMAADCQLAREKGIAGVCLWVVDGAQPPETFQIIHTTLLE